MASLCDGTRKYPLLVWEQHVKLDERGRVLCRMNELAAEQLGHDGLRLFGRCSVCGSDGYQITDDGTVKLHHLIR